MKHPPILFFGLLAAMGVSWFGMVLVPASHLGAQQPVPAQVTGDLYPQARAGLAEQGRHVYRQLGCVACHTQQVRPMAGDLARFGGQPTVAQDYLYDLPALTGSIRVGQDLANIGLRQPTAEWHLKHLYDPQGAVPGSTMPPYRFLFEKATTTAPVVGSVEVAAGVHVVPRHEAHALVAYLRSLRVEAHLFERPAPPPPPAPASNAPGATNAPAQ